MIQPHRTDFSNAANRTGKGIDSPLDIAGHTALHMSVIKGDVVSVGKLLQMRANPHQPDKQGQPPLYEAIKARNFEIIKLLMAHGATFNVEDTAKRTPLMWAIEQKCSVDFLEKLRQLGMKLDAPNKGGQQALHIAAAKNLPEIVSYLVKNGAPLNALAQDGKNPLHLATENKAHDAMKALLENGADPLTRTKEIKTPLLIAASAGDEIAVDLLLAQPFVKQTVDDFRAHGNGYTPLMAAVAANQIAIAEKLIKIGANLNQRDMQNRHCLYIAVESGHLEMTEMLIKNGADVEKAQRSAGNSMPMLHRINAGHYNELLHILYQAGVNINITDSSGQTALHRAVEVQDRKKVKMLLDLGADPNLPNRQGRRPIDVLMEVAPYTDVSDLVRQLIEHHADTNLSTFVEVQEAPLHVAAREGKEDLVALLLAHNAAVDERERLNGMTPWLVAIKANQPAISDLLAQKGADIAKKDKNLKGALHIAAEEAANESLKHLLQNPVFLKQIDARDNSDSTPLHHACRFQYDAEAALILLKAGADPLAYDGMGMTALHLAVESGNEEMFQAVQKSLSKEVDWNIQTRQGKDTLLHLAVGNNNYLLTEQLLKLGVNPLIKNENGDTPLAIAASFNNEEITELLQKAVKPAKKPRKPSPPKP